MRKLSASQLSKYVECPTRWGHIYLGGTREPFARSAQAGSEVHALLEVASKDAPPDKTKTWDGYPIGVMADTLWTATPDDITGQERSFDEIIDGIAFTGRIDFDSPVVVGDYKSTSKAKYVKTARTLSKDIQRLLYVEVLKPQKTLWLYSTWENPTKAIPVEIPVDAVKDREKFKLHVLSVAEEVSKIDAGVDPLSLPKNTKSCSLYPRAGCPFKSKCFPATTTVGFNMSSILEKLRLEQQNTSPLLDDGVVYPVITPVADEKPAGESDSEFAIEVLYVDAIPLNQTYTSATKLLAEASQQVADDMHVQHVLLIDYNKGSAMLAAQFAANVKANPEKAVVLETKSSEGKAVLHVAMSLSRNVVKGVF